jgi:tetratricopeptide (TPR) repeat protein
MLISQARNNLNHKEWDLALEDLRAAAVLKPDAATTYNLMGVAFFLKNDYLESVREFSHAMELDPNYKEAVNNLGNAYFMTGDYVKAEAILKKALTFSPPPIASFYSLGTLLAIQGRLTESREYLSMGIEHDPEFIETNDNFITHFSSTNFGASEFNFLFAKAYAASGHIKKTLDFLERAKKSGFKHWDRISTDEDFEKVRSDPRIQEYLKEEENGKECNPFGNG